MTTRQANILGISVVMGIVISMFLLPRAVFGEPMRGIFCDTPAQIEKLASLKKDVQASITEVNAEFGKDSCVAGVVDGEQVKLEKTIESTQGLLDIVGIRVNAVLTERGMMRVPEVVWYTLFASKKSGI